MRFPISLDKKNLKLIFLICLLLTLFSPTLVPQLRLTFFAPFLIMACYQKTLLSSLWLAVMCGLILDLLVAHSHFGLCALDFCLTIALIYPQRRNFFADSLGTLPAMTFFFASISALIMGVLLYNVEMENVFSWPWVLTDLVLMPMGDAGYAFICFILPALLFGKQRRRGKDYFLQNP